MINNEPVIPPPVFRDRKPLLVVFGILQIFTAVIIVALVLFVIISQLITKSGMSTLTNLTRVTLPFFLFYGMLVIWLIWMGVGSIKAKRWARTLILSSSWLWFVFGVIGMIVMLFFMHEIFKNQPNIEEMSQIGKIITKIVIVILTLIFYVLIPGMFILIYSRRNIKMTCEFYDRQIRWTDQCPLLVLALVLLFGFGSIFFLGMLFYSGVALFFGHLVSGVPGIIILLFIAAIFGYLAWGMYSLNIKTWWVAVLFIVLASISTALTFYRLGFKGVFIAMSIPEQIKLLNQIQFSESVFEAFYGIWGIPMAGYLWFIRRYFVGEKQERL